MRLCERERVSNLYDMVQKAARAGGLGVAESDVNLTFCVTYRWSEVTSRRGAPFCDRVAGRASLS